MANLHVIFGILMFLVVSHESKLILKSAAPQPSNHVQNAPLVEFFYWNVDPFFHIPRNNPANIHGNIIGLFIYYLFIYFSLSLSLFFYNLKNWKSF